MSRRSRPYLVIQDGIPVWTSKATGSPSAAEVAAARRKHAEDRAIDDDHAREFAEDLRARRLTECHPDAAEVKAPGSVTRRNAVGTLETVTKWQCHQCGNQWTTTRTTSHARKEAAR